MEVTGEIDDKDDRLEFVCLSCVQKCYSGYIQAKRGWVRISKPIADDKDFMLVKIENEESKHGYQKCLNDIGKVRKDLLISVREKNILGYNITIRISRSGLYTESISGIPAPRESGSTIATNSLHGIYEEGSVQAKSEGETAKGEDAAKCNETSGGDEEESGRYNGAHGRAQSKVLLGVYDESAVAVDKNHGK